MIDFNADCVGEIEALLEQNWPGDWRRLTAHECGQLANRFRAGWRLDLPLDHHGHPAADFGWIFVDDDFPLSDVRVVIPRALQRRGQRDWPHVEDGGLLCLTPRPANLPASRRIELAVSDAVQVLRLDRPTRDAEFRREFLSYWNRDVTESTKAARSIVVPGGQTRDIVYTMLDGLPVFADDEARLRRWLDYSGVSGHITILPTRLIALPQPLVPAQYPAKGIDVLNLDARDQIVAHIKPPNPLPVLLEAQTASGPVFACSTLQGGDVKAMRKGFQSVERVPPARIQTLYAGQQVLNRAVLRQDAAWVHGRGLDTAAQQLFSRSATIVGCGALGSEIARLLGAAGVGQIVLVDKDHLKPENTSRHILGADDVRRPKAEALANRLKHWYPHMGRIHCYTTQFELLSTQAKNDLAQTDLVICAGLSPEASLHVSQWLTELRQPPKWIDCWTEEFACVGHAVARSPGTSMFELVDPSGRRLENLTSHWPPDSGTRMEAGCGTAFQPYNATDLLGTVGVSMRLILDVLLDREVTREHRIWLGDRQLPVLQGASICDSFDTSFAEKKL